MTKNYTCEMCNKEFKQKIDFTRHKNKKNACISADKVKELINETVTQKSSISELNSVFKRCLDVLRDNEYLTGDKALRVLSYFLVLRLIEPKIGKEIHFDARKLLDVEDEEDYYEEDKKDYTVETLGELLYYVKFSNLANLVKEDSHDKRDIAMVLDELRKNVFLIHPDTKNILREDVKTLFKRDNTYKKIVDTLAKFNFEAVPEDVQGHAYEQVIKDLMVGKVLGQFFTQPIVKDMMVELINPQLHPDGTIESIFDPAMGTGGFLKTCLFHIEKQAQIKGVKLDWENITRNLGGREVEPDTFTLAKSNMLICSGHMFSESVSNEDSIRKPIKEKYDVILTNPPFGIKGLKYDEITDPLRDEYLPIKGNSAVPLFIQAIIYMLKVGGRCAVVLPCGQELFGQAKALVAVREYLMKTCDLKEIIYLPSGVFTNTTIKTCVFYFHKKKECGDVIKASKAKNRTYTFTKTLATKKVKFYNYDTETKAKNLIVEVEAQQIADNGYSLNHADYIMEKEENDNYGVVVKKLGEVCEFKSGRQLSRKDMTGGDYPVIGGGKQPTGTHNLYNRDENTILCASSGSAGYISMYGTKVWASDCFSIHPKECLDNKYFYLYLKSIQDDIYKKQSGVAQPHVYSKDISDIPIPIPPLSVQEDLIKRVERLNEFCAKTTKLKHDKIQNLKDSVKIYIETFANGQEKRLGEVCDIEIGGTPLRNKEEYWNNGTLPWVSVRELNSGYIYDSTEKITELGAQKSSVKLFPVNTVLFSFKLSIGKTAIAGVPLYTNEAIAGINSKADNLKNMYIYHYLSNTDFTSLASGVIGTGSLNKKTLVDIPIPIPPLHIQQKIIDYCDHMNGVISTLEKEPELNKELIKGLFDSVLRRASTVKHTDLGDGFVLEEDSNK